MRNQIVILAAGKGIRMGEIPLPKVLIMLKNKPLILYLLEELEKVNQLIEPVIVVGYMHGKVRAVLGDNYIYALQEPQLGTARAVMAAKNKIKGKDILVLYGDMPFIKAASLKNLIKLHHQATSLFSMLTSKAPNFEDSFMSLSHFGRIIRDEKGQIKKIVEYKDASGNERKITEVNPGIFMFNTHWLWENIGLVSNNNLQKEYYLTDLVEIAIQQGITINTLPVPAEQIIGINSKEELEIAEGILSNKLDKVQSTP